MTCGIWSSMTDRSGLPISDNSPQRNMAYIQHLILSARRFGEIL
jgi:hypothetical protein